MNIKTVNSKSKLREIFIFLSKLFYNDALEYNETYYTMNDRYREMIEQYKKDKKFIIYIEEKGNIIAALVSKEMDLEKQKITLSVMGVSKNYRKKGYASILIDEFEKRCKKLQIKNVDLGARFRACPLYLKKGYIPQLMIQVYDFATIENIIKANKFKLKIIHAQQLEYYGFVFFDVKEIKEEYIKHFEKKVPTARAQFTFHKLLKQYNE